MHKTQLETLKNEINATSDTKYNEEDALTWYLEKIENIKQIEMSITK
ncbi:hypothetical protein [Mycoplasmopsis alligatoris]|uniref:Conserved domain protein n=1 Tax=Mycoplasmopsis alligatoris A21JP2 TaxID=747682 RepID=D4XV14_9BACT|nr:hypothetical protein [Mycoplasmopsis alligatoris]EFF41850.1 conserved domain protein [Mycoplasmopsis alligatoris A21JP2]